MGESHRQQHQVQPVLATPLEALLHLQMGVPYDDGTVPEEGHPLLVADHELVDVIEHLTGIRETVTVVIDQTQMLAQRPVPVLGEDEIRIILTWSNRPADLEAHLTSPNPDGCRYHCYYWNKTIPDANLDLDDRNGYGPETITITNKGPGTKPMVYREDLLDWWDKLAVKADEAANQRDGRRLSAEDQYNYSRGGAAAPEIGGA